jgi:hypothetical protein
VFGRNIEIGQFGDGTITDEVLVADLITLYKNYADEKRLLGIGPLSEQIERMIDEFVVTGQNLPKIYELRRDLNLLLYDMGFDDPRIAPYRLRREWLGNTKLIADTSLRDGLLAYINKWYERTPVRITRRDVTVNGQVVQGRGFVESRQELERLATVLSTNVGGGPYNDERYWVMKKPLEGMEGAFYLSRETVKNSIGEDAPRYELEVNFVGHKSKEGPHVAIGELDPTSSDRYRNREGVGDKFFIKGSDSWKYRNHPMWEDQLGDRIEEIPPLLPR